jgi:hypothetical protein
MDNFQDFIRILKSITLGDILGCIGLFVLLYIGLFGILVYG